jgi:cyclomaltodextrinase / maltogenic alpha-amylase / neopullulanase
MASIRPRSMLALLLAPAFACNAGQERDAPARPPGDPLLFTYQPPANAPPITALTVPGTFNDWSTTATAMQRQPDGSWQVRIPPTDGEHQYKFHINGAWIADMCRDTTWGDPDDDYRVHTAERCVSDGNDGRNAVADFGAPPLGEGPGIRHDPLKSADLSIAGGRIAVRFHANERQVRSARLSFPGGGTSAMHRQLRYRRQEVWRGTLLEGTASYSIEVETPNGRESLGPFTVPSTPFRAVTWVARSIGYQIFPERFQNGDLRNDSLTLQTDEHSFMPGDPPVLSGWADPPGARHCCHQYFGGDLQGILDRLDHLQSLGVTLLYLNPISSAGSAHGYDTWDYERVEPAFGDERLLSRLLEAARARGMRVMWDFVPNHVGVGHPAFQDAVKNGTTSRYWSWFTFKAPPAEIRLGDADHYDTFAGVGAMPKLNTANPAVREHLFSAVRKWTRFGFAGIRVDVPNELRDRTEFFRAFRQTAKEIDPDVYLVGEIWRRAPEWVEGDQFDALMNYAVGQDAIERFVTQDITGAAALDAMAQVYAAYPEASIAMSFNVISTHDNARLLTKLGGGGLGDRPGVAALERQRLASAMLFSLPGVPVTFQGDECAFLGAGGSGTREENRYPMQWATCDQAMIEHYRQLARSRAELAALSSPAFRTHHGDRAVVAFFRGEPGPGEVLAIFNAGATGAALELPVGRWTDLASGQAVSGLAQVGPRDWRYLHHR